MSDPNAIEPKDRVDALPKAEAVGFLGWSRSYQLEDHRKGMKYQPFHLHTNPLVQNSTSTRKVLQLG